MRVFLSIFLPIALFAQAPAPKSPATPPAAPRSPATPAAPKPAAAGAPTTEDDKIIYAVGLSIYRNLSQLDLTPAEVEIVKKAIGDAAQGKPAVDIEVYGPQINTLASARASRVTARTKASSAEYLTKAAREPGAVKSDSGMIYKELTPGTGVSPKATDTVKVNYRGTLTDGTEFDSSYKRNMPAEFPLNQVIKCWTEGVQKMRVGGKSSLVCPADIAYGDQGRPGIPGGATLVFEVELLDVSGAGAEPKK
jgi:FKBP-type peptidyl-prolyl cis-trans isomerase FkpA